MVGRRAALERERRLGSFVVELARWLLAAPETQLLLRYTLQSLMELVEAQGAFVALKQPDGQNLRISPALGEAAPRSEEHTSELQSLRHLVCRLLLEKKNKTSPTQTTYTTTPPHH